MFKYEIKRKLSYLFVACALMATAMATVIVAQKPGDKVEYKAQNWPEKWEVGVFIKELPNGKQVLIAEKPNEYYPEGFHRAYDLADVRPVQKAQEEPARNNAPAQPDQADNRAEPGKNNPRGNGPAGPQMSQQDVLSFLRQRVGDGDPWRNPPKLAQAKQELRAEIMRRGVDFHYASVGKFSDELSKFGATTEIVDPLGENYGPPAKRSELFGRWLFSKIGAGSNPRFGRTTSSLTINPNGTYVWNTDSGEVRGKWRNATAEEMDGVDKGGEGLVLLSGKSGSDWIVFDRDEEGAFGQGIKVEILPSHNLRERGTRG